MHFGTSCFLNRFGKLEYLGLALEYNHVTTYTDKTRYTSYLVEEAVAALGTRSEGVGEEVKSCVEVETSMSMSIDVMMWQVQRLVVLDIVTETLMEVLRVPRPRVIVSGKKQENEKVSDERRRLLLALNTLCCCSLWRFQSSGTNR